MITLYVRRGCPYCEKTIATAEELHAPLTLKSVDDEGVTQELETRGGKVQMPYMVDDETGTEMYESEDIMAYLHKRFGNSEVG